VKVISEVLPKFLAHAKMETMDMGESVNAKQLNVKNIFHVTQLHSDREMLHL
jgi:hypothetical protein